MVFKLPLLQIYTKKTIPDLWNRYSQIYTNTIVFFYIICYPYLKQSLYTSKKTYALIENNEVPNYRLLLIPFPEFSLP